MVTLDTAFVLFKETCGPDNTPRCPAHLQKEARPHASGKFSSQVQDSPCGGL